MIGYFTHNPKVTYPHPEEVNAKGCHIYHDKTCAFPDKYADFYVDLPAFGVDLSGSGILAELDEIKSSRTGQKTE